MRIVTKRLRLESCGFRYKAALYLSYLRYLHVKFDYEIKVIGSTIDHDILLTHPFILLVQQYELLIQPIFFVHQS